MANQAISSGESSISRDGRLPTISLGVFGHVSANEKNGTPERARTSDLQIRNLSLCPAELLGHL